MWLIIKILAIIVAILAGLAALALWQPVAASRFIWPIVEDRMLEEPFLGVTAEGTVEPNLFPIHSTGVSTQALVDAANSFIASLDSDQRARLMFPVDDSEWRRWANIHISTRQGVGFLEFDEAQAEAAINLLRAGLSAKGLATSQNIMKLEGHLADLMDDHNEYGEKRYWLTIMGQPSATEPWGWQLDGHHLVINYFVLGDQVVMTPTFMGSEPPVAKTGRYVGTAILGAETEAGLLLVRSLDASQRSQAVVSTDKTANNNRGELFQDNAIVPYEGLRLAELNAEQGELARSLIALYIGNLREDQAQVRMAEIEEYWSKTYFSWVGETETDSVFYYRIHNPVVMIEFDHQLPVALDGPELPTRDHVHTVVRTPNGNDYGKDLLRQHLQLHPH